MHLFFHIFGLQIPGYGLFITLGVLLGNVVVLPVLKREKLDFLDFITIEAYCFLGAFLGAKLLYFVVMAREIEWSRIFEEEYLLMLVNGGFVFYGGMIGGILTIFLAKLFHKIDVVRYLKAVVFLIPFMHSFGRIGCFMAGCCFGIPYQGFGAVVFPEGCCAPAGVALFPVQPVEAACLMLISMVILYLRMRHRFEYTVETYLLLYAPLRFGLEFLRYDEERGKFGLLSTSQWISIALVIAVAAELVWRRARAKKQTSAEVQ